MRRILRKIAEGTTENFGDDLIKDNQSTYYDVLALSHKAADSTAENRRDRTMAHFGSLEIRNPFAG